MGNYTRHCYVSGVNYPGRVDANLAVIRHIALNLIKTEKTSKVGIKIKRLKAGWDNDYLLRVIGII